MNKRFLIFIAAFGIALTAVTFYYVYKIRDAAANFQARAEMPAFSFTQFDGEPFTRDSLRPGVPTVLVLFDPDCEHCQEELTTIQQSIAAFQGVELLLVSPADRSRLIPYASEKGLTGLPGVHVVGTEAPHFLEMFGTTKMPTTFFYGGDRKLRQEEVGRLKEGELLEGLEKLKNQ
jgi:peroxiredoxin